MQNGSLMKTITLLIPHHVAKDVHDALQSMYESLAGEALQAKDQSNGSASVATMRRALAVDLVRNQLHDAARREVFGW